MSTWKSPCSTPRTWNGQPTLCGQCGWELAKHGPTQQVDITVKPSEWPKLDRVPRAFLTSPTPQERLTAPCPRCGFQNATFRERCRNCRYPL